MLTCTGINYKQQPKQKHKKEAILSVFTHIQVASTYTKNAVIGALHPSYSDIRTCQLHFITKSSYGTAVHRQKQSFKLQPY